MRILVTGGSGFIGSNLCRHLIVDKGLSVLNLDSMTYAAHPDSLKELEAADNYAHEKIDICDQEAVEAALNNFEPDAIMHLAAESHVDRSIDRSDSFVRTNVLGTHSMLEASRRHIENLSSDRRDDFRFLHVSTDEVYGSLGAQGKFREDTPYDPSSPYSASKAASDHLASAWHRTFGVPVLISNCSNNYGPYQFPEKLIPLMILNARDGRPLPVYGDGSNVRDWLHVGDHVRALVRVLEAGTPGETYNIGGDSERSNLEVVETICRIMDRHHSIGAPHASLIDFVEDRPGHDWRYAIDAGKIQSELGWRAEEDFEAGIEKTVLWYLENEAWWRPLREGVYAGARLGLHGDFR
ncbi:dTDP-glucose 4,6-dehydratase [Tepidamorphus sp. 3E244]|uniref:dTDP-glucose 4,6-dehydratase n=1 Tax=Tepidamorphus sp. 3E244 TaxID=3385498 RepID=UPI0038FCC748